MAADQIDSGPFDLNDASQGLVHTGPYNLITYNHCIGLLLGNQSAFLYSEVQVKGALSKNAMCESEKMWNVSRA